MSVIKQVSVFRNDNWQISDIGVNASNVDLSSTVALNVPKTLYLRCRQTSGTTLVCEGKIEVCRVK